MKIQYVTDSGRIFDSEEELNNYEAAPKVFIVTIHSLDNEVSYQMKHNIVGVFLTNESALIAKEQFYNNKKNKNYYGNFKFQKHEIKIEEHLVSSCYGIEKENISKKLWNKFRSIFNQK